ncbi:MAG: bifunctional 5,10-methylenetetrahydrofolate dehydrogenase/5,10-methenyltetrahydrofolate cyclohydrolase [Candidatus Paceibacterota bacterium]|jgi:methylenetetrahydrofolate dehydrogenase (NADP+)/methenyltetrahydrofolate cyclohydrolase
MVKILDGKIVRDEIVDFLSREVKRFKTKPQLVIIQIGSRADSDSYIKQKKIFGERIGAKVTHLKFKENITEKKLLSVVLKCNIDKKVSGIIVQLPLPKQLNSFNIIESISPKKDVDGLTSVNLKKLITNDESGFLPATPKGIVSLFEYYKVSIRGKKIVVVGRSPWLGKPLALLLINNGATVTVCHSGTKNLATETKNTEILIVATGKPKLIGKKHVSSGQVVIDVGINKVDGKLVGDVDFEAVKNIVKAITPVPGGVGPLTVASLFQNLVLSVKNKN